MMISRLFLMVLFFALFSCVEKDREEKIDNVGTLLYLKKGSVIANKHKLVNAQVVIKIDSYSKIVNLKNYLIENHSKKYSLWFFDENKDVNWSDVKEMTNIENIY